jgi:tetratricopeptide (TPR) repeat protein
MKFHSLFILLCACFLAACDMQQDNPLSSPSEYYEQGVRYFDEGAFHQAEVSFARSIALLPKGTEFINIAELYGYLGRTSLELGEYRAALDNFDRAIERSAQLNDYRLEAQLCSWNGDAFVEMRKYAEAIRCYRKSMRLSSALDDVATRAQTSLRMASAMMAAGMLDQASNVYGETLGVLQSARKHEEVAQALEGMGDIYRRQGRFPEALNLVSQALETLGATGNPLLQAKLKMTLALVHRAQSDPNGAITELRDAVNILRRAQTGKEYEALFLFYLGRIYEDNGRLGDARKYYSDALEIDRSLGDKIAEDYLYLFIIRCNLELMTDDQRGQVLDKLLQSYQQIAAKFHECGHRTGEAYVYTLIGSIFESENNLGGARAMYQKAVDLDLEIRGEYYDTDLHLPFLNELGIAYRRNGWYDKLASVLLQMNLKYDAIAVMDLSQLKSSMDAFEYLDVALRHPQLKDLVKDCRSALNSTGLLELELTNALSGKQKSVDSRRVMAIQSQLADLRAEVQEETNRITAVQPNYEVLLNPVLKRSQDLQKLIPAGTVVLQFLPGEKELDLFALTRDRLDVQRVAIGKDSLTALVREYEQLLQDPSVYAGAGGVASLGAMTRFEKLSTQLYDCFIRPMDSRLDRSLVIIPRDEFGNFPFQALERQDRNGNVKYLIELTSVDYLPSLSSLQYGTVNTTNIHTVVACGNPTGQNWSVDYELRDIRSFFKSATIMLGVDATWANLLDSKGDILQLSTDFANTTDRYDLGTFVCSTGKTLGETENIAFEQLADHAPFPIIDLSNQQIKGEGLTPLHALLLRMNGTSDVFLNAWLADRKVAKFFSEYLYTNLAAGLAPGDAYRQALLNLIGTREVSHPHSWGQFFHFGIG